MNVESFPHDLGGWTLLRHLGSGAFGAVYEARNHVNGRLVALKVLKNEFRPDDEAWQRFHKEAQTAARLSHSRCVFVYAAHLIDGAPAIEMELATGGTLQQRIESGEAVPIEQALTLAAQLLEGVGAAHEAGVLHRDIKPTNCFLTDDGQLKVGDFGLSRLLEGDPNLTGTGRFMGTPLFASPEQVRGDPIDARSDVYSAAATIYNLIAGAPPIVARTYEECIGKVLTQPPPPLERLRPEVPKGLSAVLLRAMAKDPKRRPATCAELRSQLEMFRIGRASMAPISSRLMAGVIDNLAIALLLFLIDVEFPSVHLLADAYGCCRCW